MKTDSPPSGPRAETVELIVLLTAVALVAGYVILRYAGLWGETDTSAFANAIRAMLAEARLVPAAYTYPNGYGFQSLATFLIRISGLSLVQLQVGGGALLAVWLVLPAWLAFKALTDSARGAALATLILFIQPEFLFPILRGTHEKFTRGLMLLALYLLIKSLRSRSNLSRFGGGVLAFYVTIFTIIALNNLLATSFMVAVMLALLLNWLVMGRQQLKRAQSNAATRRLVYVLVGSVLLAFMFIFYIYQPAQHDLWLMQSIWDQLAALFLDLETNSINPYNAVNAGWVTLPVYFLVSLANWLLLGASAMIWLWNGRQMFRRERPLSEHFLLLWTFYGAFAFIGFLSILVDFSGAIAGNLQLRTFPSFTMLAAPLVATWLISRPVQLQQKRWPRIGLVLLVGVLSILSILKATNEPLLSNKWSFHLPGEMQAINWSDETLAERSLWTAFDERLTAAVGIQKGRDAYAVRLDQYTPDSETRDFLLSDVTRARGYRLKLPLPVRGDSLITYDNGQAQIYHTRPVTPFQR